MTRFSSGTRARVVIDDELNAFFRNLQAHGSSSEAFAERKGDLVLRSSRTRRSRRRTHDSQQGATIDRTTGARFVSSSRRTRSASL
jgi:hypothetical protein